MEGRKEREWGSEEDGRDKEGSRKKREDEGDEEMKMERVKEGTRKNGGVKGG